MGDILGFWGTSDHDRENELCVRDYKNELLFATRGENVGDRAICCPTKEVKRAEKSLVLPTLGTASGKLLKGSKRLCGTKVGRKSHVFVLSDRLLEQMKQIGTPIALKNGTLFTYALLATWKAYELQAMR